MLIKYEFFFLKNALDISHTEGTIQTIKRN